MNSPVNLRARKITPVTRVERHVPEFDRNTDDPVVLPSADPAEQSPSEPSPSEPAARAPRRRMPLPNTIFSWLKRPGDDLPERARLVLSPRALAVREFWQSNIKIFNRLFLALPVLAAATYLYLIATDGYRVESVIAIRNPVNTVAQSGGSMAGFLSGVASSGQGYAERAIDESFAVVNFIRSREAFAELEKRMNLSERFMGRHIDWFNRLPAESEFEKRYRYYLNSISVYYSDIEGQITLTTDAFDPETAYQMAQELSRMSEKLVNQFNERSRSDLIRLAQIQLTEAEEGLRLSMQAMTELQLKNGMLDPTQEAVTFNSIIASLREQVAVKRAELGALVNTSAPDSPRLVEIRNMLSSLEAQIRTEQERLTGRTDALAPLISKFKLLNIDAQLAQQKYNSAAAMLQSALLQSEHQKLYVVNIVSPEKPVQSIIPKRFQIMLGVIGITFLAWILARLIIAAIRDHSV